MITNIYMLQKQDGSYRRVSRKKCNEMVEAGKAHWIGSDGDEKTNTVTHYADRGEE